VLRPRQLNDSEACTACKPFGSIITAVEKKVVLRRADYVRMDLNKHLDITESLNTRPVMELMQNYISNWKTRVLLEFHCKSFVTNRRTKIFG
jgi:hypothetical protein